MFNNSNHVRFANHFLNKQIFRKRVYGFYAQYNTNRLQSNQQVNGNTLKSYGVLSFPRHVLFTVIVLIYKKKNRSSSRVSFTARLSFLCCLVGCLRLLFCFVSINRTSHGKPKTISCNDEQMAPT